MMIFVMLSISMASVERINEVLNTESTIVSLNYLDRSLFYFIYLYIFF